MDSILKGQKIPSFEGKKEKFPQWAYTFLSICSIAGCKDALINENFKCPKFDENLDETKDTDKIRLRKANATAYALLTITIKDPTGFQAVRNGKTKELPDGSAFVAWKNLLRIYQPKSNTQRYELEQKFNDLKLDKDSKNPDEWFTELEHIRVLLQEDHSFEITDSKMIQHIVYNIKVKAYDTVIFSLKRDLEYKNNTSVALDLERVKDEIRQVYGSIKTHKTTETALAATHGKGKFKHFKGSCRLCGARGHKSGDCWDNDRNKDKRPEWYKSPEERKKNGNRHTANAATTKTTKNDNNANTANVTTGKKTYHCDYCNRDGHTEDRCYKKLKDELAKVQGNSPNTANVALFCYNTCMLTADYNHLVQKTTFIADSGASTHMVHSRELLTNFIPNKNEVKIGDKTMVESLGMGTFTGTHLNADGQEITITLRDVILVPSLWVNLFSITKATSNSTCKVICEDKLITVQAGQHNIHFNKELPHGDGVIMATDIIPTKQHCVNAVVPAVPYHDLHNQLGHAHKETVLQTAKAYEIPLSHIPSTPICEDCAFGKIKVKNLGHPTNKATKIGERISMDISSIHQISFGGAKFWLLLQDEFTGYLWSYFLPHKSDLTATVIKWLKLFQKQYNTSVQHIRCDNAGENKKLQESLIQEDGIKHIQFEYTAPFTPQQNGKIERKFATLWSKVRAMLNSAKLPWGLRHRLWAQCAQLATKLENILVTSTQTKSPYFMLHGKHPLWINNLHSFGELAVVHDGKNSKISGKLNNKGLLGMFVGYSDDHAGEVCQFLNLETNHLIQSRTTIFLNKMYGDYHQLDPKHISNLKEEVNLDSSGVDIDFIMDHTDPHPPTFPADDQEEPFLHLIDDIEPEEAAAIPQISTRGLRELRSLQTYFNPDPYQHIPTANLVTFSQPPNVALQATVYDGNPDPKTYQEAKASPDWPNWWGAICNEFEAMHEKQVWTIIPRSKIPPQDDGRFRARTVAKGFTQIPGKDFQENHSPVVNDTTFHTILVLKLLLGLDAGQFDIETAFLYGELEEELWMDLPEGYSEYLQKMKQEGKQNKIPITTSDYLKQEITNSLFCCELKKAIYGLVQAARQWWKKFKEVIRQIGYKPSLADPCLFVKDNGSKSFIIIYVDDGGIFGTQDEIKQVLKELGKIFKVKDLGKLENFIGCKIIENQAKDTLWIHQPKLLKHLKQAFGKLIEDIKEYKTPAAPKTSIVRPQPGEPLISPDDQKLYRSGVGMLLYLVKHSRPDISNAVRELSKVADGATLGNWKSMLRTIKYVIDTETKALKLNPKPKNGLFFMEGLSDSNFAEDKETRISVYGYVLYFCGAPIATKSKMGRSVTQSSTEAEYFAVSEIAKEILFTKQLLDTIGIKIELPIVIRVDNIGAIFLANNFSIGQRTKHIDIRAHFIREYIEDDILKLVFIRSEDNDSDIFTKNLSEDLFNKHSNKMIEELT
jgi:Reverse transcriptase (RNA-dependent DNA polymerase)